MGGKDLEPARGFGDLPDRGDRLFLFARAVPSSTIEQPAILVIYESFFRNARIDYDSAVS